MKIIHITIDEKFINSAVAQFDALIGFKSTFYILSNKADNELRYVENKSNVHILNPTRKNLALLAAKTKNTIVVFHGFTFNAAYLVSKIKRSNNNILIWIGWGAEFYSNSRVFKNKNHFLKEETVLLQKVIDSSGFVKKYSNPRQWATFFKDGFTRNNLAKMDYIGVSYDEQKFELNSKFNKEFSYFNFMYYPIERMVTSLEDTIHGNNILLGNSASATNNHLEIINLLKENDIGEKRIYCPLSYGNEAYRNLIIDVGAKELSQNFTPLVDFIPLREYNNLVKSCGIVIMNHKRQQAFGNIITMLYYGAKIFLDEQNSIFHYLTRIGIRVHSIQKDLEIFTSETLNNLTIEQQEANRKIIVNEISSSGLQERLQLSFLEIASQNGH